MQTYPKNQKDIMSTNYNRDKKKITLLVDHAFNVYDGIFRGVYGYSWIEFGSIIVSIPTFDILQIVNSIEVGHIKLS
jgi:hypothetical protein